MQVYSKTDCSFGIHCHRLLCKQEHPQERDANLKIMAKSPCLHERNFGHCVHHGLGDCAYKHAKSKMEKKRSNICIFFVNGKCRKGDKCPFKHVCENNATSKEIAQCKALRKSWKNMAKEYKNLSWGDCSCEKYFSEPYNRWYEEVEKYAGIPWWDSTLWE